ncbi:hypothetical protein NW762_011387 [Fusarium torreyae]|uniref:Nucleoside phosphorylase domain-containing protein n=1 Tax=Fusarium torreyae TaxID=1237075 RepID=A0A9W8V9A1_9HYPO|nr:hypothetical protein NW762_011387 [Fusarium torreyae]
MPDNKTALARAATTIPPEDITVAIFCALSIESVAVRYTLDERYESHPVITGQHNYVYNYGRIGDHNIVLARPHHMGPVKAAQCAATVAQQFPNVRFALMVGIGAGIPSPKVDIRLGDVAVSMARDGHPGVIQYDYGKYEKDGSFTLKGWLDKPPGILVSADGSLEEDEEMDESPLRAILASITIKKGYARPTSADVLFEASFQHVNKGEDCSGCEASIEKKIEGRRPRDENVKVHRGLILSGGGVIKNAIDRSELRRGNDNAICYEMEAAGIMDQIPCLVIRGICDYADTHKNDDWHRYAAAVAAAYAKAILTKIHVEDLKQTTSMKEVIDQFERKVQEVGNDIKELKQHAENSKEDKQRETILHWLRDVDWRHQLFKHLESKEPGTGQWFIDSSEFNNWFKEIGDTLLCQGLPGAGKTVMASIVIDYLQSKFCQYSIEESQARPALAFVFCNFQDRQQQPTGLILASLLLQLIEQLPSPPASIQTFYGRSKGKPLSSLQVNDLCDALRSVSGHFPRAFFVVDGLDENEEASKLVPAIISIQKEGRINFLATSRPEKRIQDVFRDYSSVTISATKQDVERYLDKRISKHRVIKDESGDFNQEVKDQLRKDVLERIGKAADGIFLLARFHMEAILETTSPNGILEATKSLPRGPDAYHEIYSKTVQRIGNQSPEYRILAKRTLEWIICAQRPLNVQELREALAIKSGSSCLDRLDLSSTDALIESCKGLVLVNKGTVQLLHHTTREYFDSNFYILSVFGLQETSIMPVEDIAARNKSAREFSEREIALACATYLSFDAFSTGGPVSRRERRDRYNHHKFYQYAAQDWGVHLRNCGSFIPEVASGPIVENLVYSKAHIEAVSEAWSCYGHKSMAAFRRGRKPKGVTSLHLAAYFGIDLLVRSLVQNIPKDQKDSFGRTPLSYAAQEGHETAVLVLLEAAADINSQDNEGWTALFFATDEGHATTVLKLLESGADTEVGLPPLIRAAEKGLEDIVRCLLERSASSDEVVNKDTAFRRACFYGHTGTAKILLDHSAHCDAIDSYGDTSLMEASRRGKLDMVRFLLEHGAYPGARNRMDVVPLWEAAKSAHMEVARILLDATSSPAVVPLVYLLRPDGILFLLFDRRTILRLQKGQILLFLLYFASIGHIEGIKRCLDEGVPVDGELDTRTCSQHINQHTLQLPEPDCNPYASKIKGHSSVNPDIQMTCGKTALWQAARKGHFAAARLLLDQGANPNTADHHQFDCTPLHYPPRYLDMVSQTRLESTFDRRACLEFMEALVQKGATVDAQDKYGESPLTKTSDITAATLLLDNSADPNHQGTGAPLLWAAVESNIPLMKLLLDRGADPNLVSKTEATSLAEDLSQDNQAAIRLLEEWGANKSKQSTRST